MRATPPCARMSAGTRSSAITAHAPASSARRACSAFTTSQITPPLSISGKVRLTCIVPVCFCMTNYLLDDWVYNVCTNILSHREKGPLQPIEDVETSHMGHYPRVCELSEKNAFCTFYLTPTRNTT